jgi:hypothetical protein
VNDKMKRLNLIARVIVFSLFLFFSAYSVSAVKINIKNESLEYGVGNLRMIVSSEENVSFDLLSLAPLEVRNASYDELVLKEAFIIGIRTKDRINLTFIYPLLKDLKIIKVEGGKRQEVDYQKKDDKAVFSLQPGEFSLEFYTRKTELGAKVKNESEELFLTPPALPVVKENLTGFKEEKASDDTKKGKAICVPKWKCAEWGACTNELTKRSCIDEAGCVNYGMVEVARCFVERNYGVIVGIGVVILAIVGVIGWVVFRAFGGKKFGKSL